MWTGMPFGETEAPSRIRPSPLRRVPGHVRAGVSTRVHGAPVNGPLRPPLPGASRNQVVLAGQAHRTMSELGHNCPADGIGADGPRRARAVGVRWQGHGVPLGCCPRLFAMGVMNPRNLRGRRT